MPKRYQKPKTRRPRTPAYLRLVKVETRLPWWLVDALQREADDSDRTVSTAIRDHLLNVPELQHQHPHARRDIVI